MVALPLPPLDEPPIPTETRLHLRRGAEALSAGETSRARDEIELAKLSEASLQDPAAKAHVLWAIGASLYAAERFEEALLHLDQALEFAPSDPQLLVARGLVLAEMKRYKDAVSSLDQSLAIQENHFVEATRREIVDSELRKLVRKGLISWSGGKPDLPTEKLELLDGPPLSEWIIESRR